jgi:hypothetical protein
MTKNCLEDLTTCLHYSDDWDIDDDEEWDARMTVTRLRTKRNK